MHTISNDTLTISAPASVTFTKAQLKEFIAEMERPKLPAGLYLTKENNPDPGADRNGMYYLGTTLSPVLAPTDRACIYGQEIIGGKVEDRMSRLYTGQSSITTSVWSIYYLPEL